MDLHVGSAVKRTQRPLDHGVVTEVGNVNVIVKWHLKQATSLGPEGMPMGTVYEAPADLTPDTPCPYCRVP